MGLFSKKKKEPQSDLMQGFGGQQQGAGQNQNQFGEPYPPLGQDQNSGLRLADLNQQGPEFAQQGGFDSFGNPKSQLREGFGQQFSPQPAPPQDLSKDIELILAKLDTIRSEITNLNHRLDKIEKQQEAPKKYPW